MGKTRRIKEFSETQKMKHENKMLRREVSRLRKLVRSNDEYVALIDPYEPEFTHEEHVEITDLNCKKKKWECFKCKMGVLLLTVLQRPDGRHYFRKCHSCTHKTKLQKYSNDIDGIFRDDIEDAK